MSEGTTEQDERHNESNRSGKWAWARWLVERVVVPLAVALIRHWR